MTKFSNWNKEPGACVQASRPLHSSKLQAPCIVRNPSGGFSLFHMAVGPDKPFRDCHRHGYGGLPFANFR
jgi:hypothetical protein